MAQPGLLRRRYTEGMKRDPRRALRLLLLAALAAPVSAAVIEVAPNVGAPGLGSLAAPAAAVGATFSGAPSALAAPSAFAPLAAPSLTAAPAAAAAPVLAAPALAAAPAASVLPTGPKAIGAAPALSDSAERSGAPALDSLRFAAASYGDRRGRNGRYDDGSDDRFFDGGRERAGTVHGGRDRRGGPSGFIKNADGVWVGGRVAEQTLWINQMYAQLSPKLDLSDVVNVMDDAYDESRVKLRSAEKAAHDHKLSAASVHLEGTRNWVDAILEDADGREIAVHTHRVYFHPAPGNPQSEIDEGIRRATKYLGKAVEDFKAGGHAEQDLQKEFKQVELNFDTRGYKEIETALRAKEAEIRAQYGDRFVFHYITEPRMASAPLRAEYNRLVELYKDQPEGLMSIIDGVTYSRTVGVGHELNSHLKREEMGLEITQAGRDFFGEKKLADGRVVEEYKTEFDAVTRSKKTGEVTLWEDKSARVWMPLENVLEDTFLYKLRIYRDNRAIIEKSLGAPLNVVFSVDVGGTNRRAAKQGILVWKDVRQKELMEYLQANEAKLSAEYGFPVKFIFVNSHPGESSDLFYQTPMDEAEWEASQRRSGGGGRKHGRKNDHQRRNGGRR